MQESILSRRRIEFSSEQLYRSCRASGFGDKKRSKNIWPKIGREQKAFEKYRRRLAGESGLNPRSFSKSIQLCATCNKAAECLFTKHDWPR